MLTDEYGFNAVTTSLSSDFVQSDEAWWQVGVAGRDHDGADVHRLHVHGATVVDRSRASSRRQQARVGVLKVQFGLAMLDSVLAQAATTAPRIDVVDSRPSKVIAQLRIRAALGRCLTGSDRRSGGQRSSTSRRSSTPSSSARSCAHERRPLARRRAHESSRALTRAVFATARSVLAIGRRRDARSALRVLVARWTSSSSGASPVRRTSWPSPPRRSPPAISPSRSPTCRRDDEIGRLGERDRRDDARAPAPRSRRSTSRPPKRRA